MIILKSRQTLDHSTVVDSEFVSTGGLSLVDFARREQKPFRHTGYDEKHDVHWARHAGEQVLTCWAEVPPVTMP